MSLLELVGNPTRYYGYLKKYLNENIGRKRLLQCTGNVITRRSHFDFLKLLSSDTGKLVISGWGDFWEVLFIFLPSCFTWFLYYGYLKKCLNENLGRKRLLDPLEEYFMYWFRLRHSIPEKVLA
jgi:hypothetical protein